MAAESVRRVMAAEINRPENRGYADNGIATYREAVARFMEREFGVKLDPTKEINHCIGTKTALAMLPAAFIDPGDVTLMTVPGYPVAGTHAKYYGGEVYKLPLLAENRFYPDLDAIPAEICRRAKLLVINYPNSPTGQVGTREFYERVIELRLEASGCRHSGCGPSDVHVRRPTLEFSPGSGGPRGRRGDPFHVEGLEYDRLAIGLGLRS